jgi:hypothetical protein
MMEGWTNPDPYVTKVEDVVCRDCGKTFQINAQYDKNGFPVFFRQKYCSECNKKLKLTGNNGSWETVNIESAKIAQRNVEGLEESLQTLATSIVNDRGEFRAFKKHAEHDIEQNKLKLENFLDVQIGVNDRVNERFAETRKSLHSTINLTFKNEKEIERLNKQNVNRFAEINHIEYNIIPKIKTLLIALHIMVLGLFVFDLGVVWYIIKH